VFEPTPSRRFEAITAIIDLEGFSTFCSQPDNHRKLALFLNFVFQRVNDSLHVAGLTDSSTHFKFLGDGALYVWSLEHVEPKRLGKQVVLALHNLYRTYPTEVLDELDDLNVFSVPKRLRVGIAQGEVTELRSADGTTIEYVGFSINLAARLQHYFPAVGFFVSCNVSLPDDFLEEYSLVRAKTKTIRGMRGVEVEVRYVQEDAAHLPKREVAKWLTFS
jgi:class 3 adenylate cyclase